MSLRYAALGLLAQQPGSGYDLMRRFEGSMANVWPATQSQLYGELGRLERDGLIEITDIGARGRKVYAATDAGRADLRTWLVDTPEAPVRSAELLKVFLLTEVDEADRIRYFRTAIVETEEHLAALEAILHGFESGEFSTNTPVGLLGRITLEYGLRSYRAELDWARWSLDLLEQRVAGADPGDPRSTPDGDAAAG